jgi:predicted nucleic acid-binding protein
MMAPAVLSELLSDPKLPVDLEASLRDIPLLDISDGYWARADRLRATVLAKRRKARLGDALIAQSCLDHHLPLITRDRAFVAFADAAGLDLVIET